MRIEILTLFPEMFAPISMSILKRASEQNLIDIRLTNIRDFSADKHKKTDDYPFGGGAGMVMTPQPAADAIRAVDPEHKLRRIYLSPKGRTLTQQRVVELAKEEGLLLFCGHYEGIDQRIIDGFIDEEISIGDYVLTGGELPAMALTDAVCRYVEGVLAEGATSEESFTDSLLEYPQYTRPEVFEGQSVPEVLLSGHHGNVEKWRLGERIKATQERRPELIGTSSLASEYFASEEKRKKKLAEKAKKAKQKQNE